MLRLILVRHGNTFSPGDNVTWVGSSNDLPLVDEGKRQAERVGQLLKSFSLAAIYHAPLKRTRQFAEIIAEQTGTNAALNDDTRLTELDYGDWSGRSDSEVVELFGRDVLDQWVGKSVWPLNANWGASEESVVAEVKNFVSDLIERYVEAHVEAPVEPVEAHVEPSSERHNEHRTGIANQAGDVKMRATGPVANVVIVSSNGRLRYFLKLVEDEFEKRVCDGSFKVGTGKVCLLETKSTAQKHPGFILRAWNESPQNLANALL